jgi:spore coat polysaccharide biosynthesis protein SpsF
LKEYHLGMEIVVATTQETQDDEIMGFCSSLGISCVRGSEVNVFDRYCLAARRYGFQHIIRLTGDNPLPNHKVMVKAMNLHLEERPDLTSTRRIETDGAITRFVPKGSSVDIINSRSLLAVDQNHLSTFEKEHVIPVFFGSGYRVSLLQYVDIPIQELSVDTGQDLDRVSSWAAGFDHIDDLKRYLGYGENETK